MSEEFPLPRSLRDLDYESDPGQTVFGPLPWLLFDDEDVLVYRAATVDGLQAAVDPEEYTVTPVDTLPGLFSIVFAEGQAEGALIRVKGARVHERQTNVTQGGVIRAAPLETELDRVTVTLQELRRDIDRSESAIDDAQSAAVAAEEAQAAAEAAQEIVEEAVPTATAAAGAALAAAASLNLPLLEAGDAGKPLVVNDAEDGYDLGAIAPVTSVNGMGGDVELLSCLSVRAAAPDNIDLSAPGANIDDIAMAAGQPFLAPFQVAGAQNGVYRWNGAAVPATRIEPFATFDAHAGAFVTVQEGTKHAGSSWQFTPAKGGVLGADAITIERRGPFSDGSFHVALSGDVAGISPGTITIIPFNTEVVNEGVTVSGNRIYPLPGLYLFSAALFWTTAVVDGETYQTRIHKNGNAAAGLLVFGVATAGAGGGSPLQSILPALPYRVVAGDFFEIYGYGTGSGNKTIQANSAATWFRGVRIGP